MVVFAKHQKEKLNLTNVIHLIQQNDNPSGNQLINLFHEAMCFQREIVTFLG
jgi:hypothetical protein